MTMAIVGVSVFLFVAYWFFVGYVSNKEISKLKTVFYDEEKMNRIFKPKQ